MAERNGGAAAVVSGVGRGLALFFSGFGLLNFLGSLLFHANFNLNIWWIDFRPLPLATEFDSVSFYGLLVPGERGCGLVGVLPAPDHRVSHLSKWTSICG